ncbi:glycosyltransferase [Lacisediminihabitans changchengi]|uniref:Glycosyltransferase n=1 Tax=Lacisediminihabitans changchengi TaxID=2787634 RepID=A0A934W326_9MICO|nr:glycosyltransferase [Lacisediminihabitans changchengi]MBK4348513.1 glycosyltransferase [Lacisediminihabitans changchengi]
MSAQAIPSPSIVYVSGSRWTDVAGTDRQLAIAIGRRLPVLWVDPPSSFLTPRADGTRPRTGVDLVAPGVARLQVVGLPGASRPVLRDISDRWHEAAIRRAVARLGGTVDAIILSSPRTVFPALGARSRLLYVTDDWQAGAALMGVDSRRTDRVLAANMAAATVVAAVSPTLVDDLVQRFDRPVSVLANGCDPVDDAALGTASQGSAVVVGQLNERLDVALLEAVRAAGIRIDVAGPRAERDPAVSQQLDQFLSAPGVTWHGRLDKDELKALLREATVGLTPYADTEFNRASFPLKTLEYLASGLRVVSTDLPAVHWLDSDLVVIADGPDRFAAAVGAATMVPLAAEERRARLSFARTHSWDARVSELVELIGV